ncbi:TPA: replication protein [Streptococcus suis]|nr:replication protein [Streptococcus suis]HEM4631426.1 replication protein [Streptococcus suis]
MKSNEIQVLDPTQRREKGDKGIVINEWEKLTAPSNRRLTHQNLRFLFSLSWSIDRITIVGNLKEFEFDHTFVTEDGEIFYRAGEKFTLNQAMPLLASEEAAERAGNGWRLLDKYGENIAYVETLPFKDPSTGKEKGRIDFNPNKIESFLKTDLKSFISMMFDNPHFSRADVACDILDLPDDYVSQYRLVDAVSFRPYYGQNGALETAYWGARSSERQVRMYNKKLEQEKKKQVLPEEVQSWWRLELQLRRSKADEWSGVVNETLDSFYSPFYFPSDISFREKAILRGLHADHSLWSEASDNTKRKYRKLSKRIAKEDELTQHLKASFSENIDTLKRELETWLGFMKVDEEE